MVGIVGFEPTVPASKAGALSAWPYPIILEIRAGLEPVIAAAARAIRLSTVGSAVPFLPFVNGLRGIEAECHL